MSLKTLEKFVFSRNGTRIMLYCEDKRKYYMVGYKNYMVGYASIEEIELST